MLPEMESFVFLQNIHDFGNQYSPESDMEIFIDIVAVILGIVGLLGCLLPVLPGPPCSFVGMLLLYLWGSPCVLEDITLRLLIIMLVVTVVVTVLDYIVPGWLTRVTGGSKYASRGATAGMVAGIIFFPPWGMIAGAFLGALLAELYWGEKEMGQGLKAAAGSFLGFILGTGLKLAASGIMMYYIVVSLIPG